jgi:hypothetical protein
MTIGKFISVERKSEAGWWLDTKAGSLCSLDIRGNPFDALALAHGDTMDLSRSGRFEMLVLSLAKSGQ